MGAIGISVRYMKVSSGWQLNWELNYHTHTSKTMMLIKIIKYNNIYQKIIRASIPIWKTIKYETEKPHH